MTALIDALRSMCKDIGEVQVFSFLAAIMGFAMALLKNGKESRDRWELAIEAVFCGSICYGFVQVWTYNLGFDYHGAAFFVPLIAYAGVKFTAGKVWAYLDRRAERDSE